MDYLSFSSIEWLTTSLHPNSSLAWNARKCDRL